MATQHRREREWLVEKEASRRKKGEGIQMMAWGGKYDLRGESNETKNIYMKQRKTRRMLRQKRAKVKRE